MSNTNTVFYCILFSIGFTTASDTWLPVNPNYEYLNKLAQEEAEVSHLKVYKTLAELRKAETFIKGEISFPFTSQEIFSFMRYENYQKPSLFTVFKL